ncbi:SMP-30/gluconolactonase/LRE family protein [Agaribacter flavus]|uniref:SMP-30/gluconolactonase/LRE family protein n=1 Tax=Agaribacter flavus TaxID=1902781 RepID=A0ABV7FIN3_9ALTE
MAAVNQFSHSFEFVGRDLVRPECVLTKANGEIYVSDFRGGVTCIDTMGKQTLYSGESTDIEDGLLQTNGFAIQNDGSFLVAHLGANSGGVYRLSRDKQITPFLQNIDGIDLPPTNFVHIDHQGRIWITVSTRMRPRSRGYSPLCKDGFIVLVDKGKASVVADNLGYTNECWVSPDGTTLYANATFSRELFKWTITPTGALVNKQLFTTFSEGTFPDGLVGDTLGNLWVTSIVSNRVICVFPDGRSQIFLEESNEEHVQKAEKAYLDYAMGREHLDNNPAALKNISSLSFGGKNCDDMYLGCLLDQRIVKIPNTGFVGHKPVHW